MSSLHLRKKTYKKIWFDGKSMSTRRLAKILVELEKSWYEKEFTVNGFMEELKEMIKKEYEAFSDGESSDDNRAREVIK